MSHGCPFEDGGVDLEGKVETLEKWVKEKLFERQSLTFGTKDFTFCHKDFAPRNIIWGDDGFVYLLDWLTAGFYTLAFEVCSQRNGISEDWNYSQRIEGTLGSIGDVNWEHARLLREAWGNCLKYAL